jgi:miniconductance mechanosensitive channel
MEYLQPIVDLINTNDYTKLSANILITILTWRVFQNRKNQIVAWLKKKSELSNNKIDDSMFGFGVVKNIILLIPVIGFDIINRINPVGELSGIVATTISVIIPIIISLLMLSIINVINNYYKSKDIYSKIPFYAGVQLVKIIIIIIAIIVIISEIMGKSPVYIFSGLGAATAVIMLIFKDVITGFVSGIHLATNNMLSKGDWITMPSKGVDGDVMEVGITTVKVRNFDKTITSVPAQQLTSNVFFNWKGMQDSGGRRIKRNILIDASSIQLLKDDDIEELKQIRLLKNYLEDKQDSINKTNKERGIFIGDKRTLTNIGTFRAYIKEYLRDRNDIHSEDFTFLVRQLEADEHGVPIQLYIFTNTVNWIDYEEIQSDIFDHLFSMAEVFKLKIYQRDNK